GANSAAVATDRGGGTITVTGGSATTSGQDSPGLYFTGVLDVTGMTIVATGSECAVIEGSNSITLYYDPNNSANGALGGTTYTLAGGGTLTPS
ncbi:MAG: hypothetical protein ACXV98_17145, partial [Ilumatobacteraceae bacterium]